jgi:ankyrin repeat protein
MLAESSNSLLVLIVLSCRPTTPYLLARSSLYTVVFAGSKEERIARELENEKREEIRLQRALYYSRTSSLHEIQRLVKACRGARGARGALSFVDGSGWTPLHTACSCKAPLEAVRYLVQEYTEPLQVTTNYGNLPLHLASVNRAPLDVVRYLVHEYPESLQVAGFRGNLPLHYACRSFAPQEVVRYLVKEYPESLRVTDKDGNLPL